MQVSPLRPQTARTSVEMTMLWDEDSGVKQYRPPVAGSGGGVPASRGLHDPERVPAGAISVSLRRGNGELIMSKKARFFSGFGSGC